MHALVACHGGRHDIRRLVSPLICSSSVHRISFLSLFVLSYSSLLFDHFPIVHSFDKFFIPIALFYICYI